MAKNSYAAPSPPPPLPYLSSVGNNSLSAPPLPPPPHMAASSIARYVSCLPTTRDSAVTSASPPPPLLSGCSTSKSSAPPPTPPPAPGLPPKNLSSNSSCSLTGGSPRSESRPRKNNLKPYHWSKLTRAGQGTLWAEAQKYHEAYKAPKFDMSELESLFSAADRRAGPKTEKVQLIEPRRAHNCESMLMKIRTTLPDLMSSVITLDDSELDVDQVDNLIKFCPTKEEMELLKNYNGNMEKLGKCEQFFLELMKVPRVGSKLQVFSYKIQFHSQVSQLRNSLNIINSACEEVRNSFKLKMILQTILSLGNALNQGTARGSAIGFHLDSLLKLNDTRAWNNKMTLMHYLSKVLAEEMPVVLDFPNDLVSLEASTKIQLKYLAEEMQATCKGLDKAKLELTASENDGAVSLNFCKNLKEFLSFAEGEVRPLVSLYSVVGRNADALVLYFVEDLERYPFERVVTTLCNFTVLFRKAHKENCKQLEIEKRKAQREAQNQKSKMGDANKQPNHLVQSTLKISTIR